MDLVIEYKETVRGKSIRKGLVKRVRLDRVKRIRNISD